MRVARLAPCLLVCSLIPVPLAAQTPPASAPQTPPAPTTPPPLWERKAELSLVGTTGNTDTQTIGAGASLVWRPAPWTTEAKVAFVRNEANDELTARSLVADFRQARALTERVDAFVRLGYLSNEFAGIDARTSIDGGIAYKLLTGPIHTLRVDTGLGYSHEDRINAPDLSFVLANFGSAYKWQISPTADITEAAILSLSLEDADDRRFSNTFALTAALTRLFSLKLSHELKFTNAPVPDFEKTDTQLSVALVVNF
jgi:putative salt-induced outer membrane protein